LKVIDGSHFCEVSSVWAERSLFTLYGSSNPNDIGRVVPNAIMYFTYFGVLAFFNLAVGLHLKSESEAMIPPATH
jgi:hypothetical protein